jgi:N-acetylglucosamine kinase-like BadF-type ATPase
MEYYVGIDGGGTKSRLLAVDKNEEPVAVLYGGSTNLASNQVSEVRETLRSLFARMFAEGGLSPEGCLGVCVGSAGLDFPAACGQMESLVRESGFACPVAAVNDSLLALAAATDGGPGVIIISGTGSIAYGAGADGTIARCGGWGHILDDGGSGYWIGKEAIRRAFLAYDGRGRQTVLTGKVMDKLGVSNLPDAIEPLYGDGGIGKPEIAEFCVMVQEGAEAGDAVCREILEEAAEELFALTDAILKKLGQDDLSVAVSGGSIQNNPTLLAMFAARVSAVYPRVSVAEIKREPVWGAIRLCRKGKGAV